MLDGSTLVEEAMEQQCVHGSILGLTNISKPSAVFPSLVPTKRFEVVSNRRVTKEV